MHKCFKCGTEFEGGFCPECGSKWQEQKTCPQCGATLAGSTKFCNECGYSFETATPAKKPKGENKFLKWLKTHLKIVIPVAVALVAVIVVCSLIPTFIVMSVNGTYYKYWFDENGEIVCNEKDFVTLSTGKWKDSDGEEGTYSLSGKNITFNYADEDLGELGDLFGEDFGDMQLKGTIKNGVLRLNDGLTEEYYVTKNHKHKYGAWEVTTEPTCTEAGEQEHACECKKVAKEVVAPKGHSMNGDYICTVCEMQFTKGLEYELVDNKYYAVKGIGTASGDIVIPDYYEKKPVTVINGEAFRACTDLTGVVIPHTVTKIDRLAFYDCTELTSVTLGNGVITIEKLAFMNCKSLESITIPNSVTTIGVEAFRGCVSLKSMTIPNSVTSLGGSVFYDCAELTSVVIGDGVTSIPYDAFKYCKKLTSVIIGNSVTNIEMAAFDNCSGLTSITIPNSVTSIEDSAFVGCTSLTSVTIGNNVTTIGHKAFQYCRGLTSITIPNSVTSIGGGAFEFCGALTSITIPNSVTSIGDNAFASCGKLTSVIIGNGVTSIESYAFYWCGELTSITIPDSVTSIGESAFWRCDGLANIKFEGTKAQWNAIEKDKNWNSSTGDYNVTCTDGKLDKKGNEVE